MQSAHWSLMLCLCVFPGAAALKSNRVARISGRGDAIKSATDFLLDAKLQTQQMDDMTKEVDILAEYVKAGGHKARSV
jgi:hypothetical protein